MPSPRSSSGRTSGASRSAKPAAKKGGDWTTVTWAQYMQNKKYVIVRTNADVIAGEVNEITPVRVRVGNTRVDRENIVSVHALPRTKRRR